MNVAAATTSPTSATAPNDPHAELRKVVKQWVGQTFFGQMLKQMRSNVWKDEMFSGGRGGQAYTAMFDQHLAERMAAGGPGDGLTEAIVKRIAGHAYRANDNTNTQQARANDAAPDYTA